MVELKYVKRRKIRKRAGIIALVSSMGLTTLGIVAFLGRNVGTFTVALSSQEVELSLSREYPLKERTTFLYIDYVPTFEQYTYDNLMGTSLGDAVLDNDAYDYDMDGAANYDGSTNQMTSLNFFKYTFYVTNVGVVNAGYRIKFNLMDDTVSTDGTNRFLSDTLRVMIYENDAESDEHAKTIYAKAPEGGRKDLDGSTVAKEYVSTAADDVSKRKPWYGFAEDFEDYKDGSGGTVATLTVDNLVVDRSIRYTMVAWLEGEDLSDLSSHAPEGATIKLGVQVNAYENKL
ncbi:hypothetical protein DYE49_00050 [Treponema rectale]|uniref:Uncharacterized protein n=1 Tax=Treponema rectale TaxID=744512 RepID=A0A7M1XJI5_9SPIR|nr:hypothetical protein DYE49_00050 [Treponema rectale]